MATPDSASAFNNNPNDDDESDVDSSSTPFYTKSGNPNVTDSSSLQPLVCLVRFASDAASGGVLGSVRVYSRKKGFKGAFSEVGPSAKTNSLVLCILKKLRGKDDVITAGVAGCCTGLALSIPGAPTALLQSCLTFGVFSFIIERLNKQQPAMAHQISHRNKSVDINLVSSLACPLPNELRGAFTSFCESLKNSKNGRSPMSS